MKFKRKITNVCVYCASSTQCDPVFFEVAEQLGRELVNGGMHVVYGGGGVGLMGALADSALAAGGKVVGVLPSFMLDLEWGHKSLTELRVVGGMHERKRMMIEESDAFIALPGGCGTFEELFEAITWKRLGLHTKPILLVNVNGFFDPCVELLERSISECFMDQRHRNMWSVVVSVEDIVQALYNAPPWDESARRFAAI